MKYRKILSVKANVLYKQIVDEELAFFQFYDASIQNLHQGLTIKRDFYTKLHHEAVPGKMKITKMKENACFETRISYQAGSLVQTYYMEASGDQTYLTYEEDNSFTTKRFLRNYQFTSLFYKLIFNHQAKKRFRYLEEASS